MGIGTTSPIYDFQIGSYGTDSDSTLALASTNSGTGSIRFGDGTSGAEANAGKISYDHNTNSMQFGTGSGTERMRINSSGNVGIGTNSPADRLHVNSGSANEVARFQSTDGTAYISIMDNSTSNSLQGIGSVGNNLTLYVNNAERVRVDSSGQLLVGGTAYPNGSASNFGVNQGGQIATSRATTGSSVHVAFHNTNGVVGNISTSGSATAFNTSSDQRLKENIANSDDAGSKIDAIQVRQFDWKADGSHQDYGMIAQELQSVAPEAVSTPEDSEEMMGVDYSKLVPMLIKEIQSLRNRVAQLEE